MFVETISAPRAKWELWTERLRLVSQPPEALVAMIAWESEDGLVTAVHVWDTPAAVAEFFVERVQPLVEAEGPPENKPERRGEPVAMYLREDARRFGTESGG